MSRGARAAALVAVAALCLAAVPVAAEPVHDTVTQALGRRLFPLLDALTARPAALAVVVRRPAVAAMLRTRIARRDACDTDVGCAAEAMVWTAAEVATLADAMPADPAQGDDGAAAQVMREVEGVNVVLRTYALGQVPRYPQIDGAGPVGSQELTARLQAAAWLMQVPRAGALVTLDPSVEFALVLLDASDRTDAIGFEPLLGGRNASAVSRARTLDWSRYRYSALIVTGVGPEMPEMALSAYGKYHLRLAAERFAAGDVPFIIVSGGRAHPRATRFTEAEEMRRALVERYAIPAGAVIIEPYARHTTTNLRNAARLLIAMGAPSGKEALIICNPVQSASIASAKFIARNAEELGYQPGTIGPRLSPTELGFRPAAQSMRIDPRDPLDP